MLKIKNIFLFVWHLPRNLTALLIKGYQKTFSPDHGWLRALFPHGYCQFSPSCSQYGYESIKKHGLIWGGLKTIWRILRCNPCSHGGYDPP